MHLTRQPYGPDRVRPGSQAGMTLVEVVVALAVTGLAVAGIVNGYRYCTNSATKASMTQAACALAMDRIEETRSAKWDTSSWPAVDQLVATNFPIKQVILDRAGSGAIAVSAIIQTEIAIVSTAPPLKRIRVDCVWQFNGDPITNSIETLRAPDQ